MRKKEKFKDIMKEIVPGKLLWVDVYDCAGYEIAIQEVNGTKVKGLVLLTSPCYPSAVYPDSKVPMIKTMEIDLAGEDVARDSIQVYEDNGESESYVRDAKRKQDEFLRTMIPVDAPRAYQEVRFVIRKDEVEDKTYCDMYLTNILSIDNNGLYKNPYVVEVGCRADSVADMMDFRKDRGSAEGDVTPFTLVTFEVLIKKQDGRQSAICKMTIPYWIIQTKEMSTFLLCFTQDVKNHIDDALKFLRTYERDE